VPDWPPWVIFGKDDAHPPSVVCLRKQKDQQVYRIKDEPADAFGCLGKSRGGEGTKRCCVRSPPRKAFGSLSLRGGSEICRVFLAAGGGSISPGLGSP
jgi:hypothetical protein